MVLDMHAHPDTLAQALEIVPRGGVLVSVRPGENSGAKEQGKHEYSIWGSLDGEQKKELGRVLYEKLEGMLEKGLLKVSCKKCVCE